MMNNYCKGIIIVQRKEEYYFFQYLKSNFHLPIKIFLEDLNQNIINLERIDYLYSNSKLCKNFFIEKEKNEIKNFFIMPILDINKFKDIKDTNEYISKVVFDKFWFKEHVIPIYMNCNFKELLIKTGAISGIENLDTTTYRKLIPISNFEEAKKSINNLINLLENNEDNNLKILFEKCLEYL